MSILFTVLICLGLAFIISEAFRKLGLPRVIGQIVAGMVLSMNVVREYVMPTESADVISFLGNLGLILLFYYIGLELNFNLSKKNMSKAFAVSLCNTLIPCCLGVSIEIT